MKKSNQSFGAQQLRFVLIGIIALQIIVGIAGVVYLNDFLAKKVVAANNASQSAELSKASLGSAQTLKIYLENHGDDVQKAAMIVAQTTAYRYQNQIVQDVTKYANAAGVTITGFTFPQDISAATVDKVTGLKSLTATLTLSDSSRYTSYLLFLKYIEQNLTKMQVTDITISPNLSDQNYINDTSIGIQVYVQ